MIDSSVKIRNKKTVCSKFNYIVHMHPKQLCTSDYVTEKNIGHHILKVKMVVFQHIYIYIHLPIVSAFILLRL